MFCFVSGGRKRAVEAIRAEVMAKYAEQLKAASAPEKKVLKRRIEAEIREKAETSAPPGALYGIHG